MSASTKEKTALKELFWRVKKLEPKPGDRIIVRALQPLGNPRAAEQIRQALHQWLQDTSIRILVIDDPNLEIFQCGAKDEKAFDEAYGQQMGGN